MQVVVIGPDTPTETLIHTIETLGAFCARLPQGDERWARYHGVIGEAQDVLSARQAGAPPTQPVDGSSPAAVLPAQ